MKSSKKPKKLIRLLKLAGIFFYIGLFTLGGGYAMVPLMKQEIVEKRKLLDADTFYEIFAISQVTPGPIAVNMATFIGYKESGILGSVFTTTGVVLPSLIIIILISLYFTDAVKNIFVHRFFMGVLTGVVAEIAYLTLDVWKRSNVDTFYVIVFVLSLIEIFVIKLNPIYVILIGGALGVIFKTKEYMNERTH
ncbi:MAG: chromate transporter [Caldisericaceae bacterium]|nr:chromate transporter [Caldisericaceae bacterium]